jgi:hypothetical protein
VNVRINTIYMKYIGQEVYESVKEMERLSSELDDVRRALKKQTGFMGQLRSLQSVKESMEDERHKLDALVQSLKEIYGLYCRTEEQIEEGFGIQRRQR